MDFINSIEASLSHHEQTMHASAEPPKQRSYPAYCDVSPAIGPGSTKIVPYAQHSVTSYINGQLHMERSMNSVPNYTVPGATNKPYLLPKPPVPPIKTESGVTVNSVANTVPNKVVVGQNSKPAVNNKSSQNVKHVMSKSIHPQFIDPPEEFQFLSSKRSRLALLLISGSIQSPLTAIYIVIVSNVLRDATPTYPYLFSFSSFQIHWHPPHPFYLFIYFFRFHRKARRALSVDIQRKVARRPWKEVKCSIKLRALIYAIPTPQENDTVEAIVIDDD